MKIRFCCDNTTYDIEQRNIVPFVIDSKTSVEPLDSTNKLVTIDFKDKNAFDYIEYYNGLMEYRFDEFCKLKTRDHVEFEKKTNKMFQRYTLLLKNVELLNEENMRPLIMLAMKSRATGIWLVVISDDYGKNLPKLLRSNLITVEDYLLFNKK